MYNCRDNDIPERQRKQISRFLAQELPIDVRPVDPLKYRRMVEGAEPKLMVWMKAKGHVGESLIIILIYCRSGNNGGRSGNNGRSKV